MGLRLSDALRLSWANIAEYKGRSVVVVATVAILFGLVMGVNFLLRGLEVTLLDASVVKTGGKVYVETSFKKSRYGSNEERLNERLEKYHGEKVGTLKTYALDGETVGVIEVELGKEFPTEEEYVEWGTEKQEMDAAHLFVSGSTPELKKTSILNLVLGSVYGNAIEEGDLVVDDGSGEIEEYINTRVEEIRRKKVANVDEMLAMDVAEEAEGGQEFTEEDIVYFYEEAENWGPEVNEESIAVFENYWDLKDYVLTRDTPEAKNLEPQAFGVGNLFSNTVDIINAVEMMRTVLKFFEIVLLVVAVVVATLTFAHLIDNDAATVALYRSMGASTGNIYAIYFLYLVELCLLAVVVSIGIGLILAGIVAVLDAGDLAVRLQEYYGLAVAPRVRLVGIDRRFWEVAGMIMLVAPLVLALTSRRFGAKHIAKKLKEDQ